jgi:hypothetical protein
MVTIIGPDIFHDDPSPEDIQRAFAAEQAQHTADFKRSLGIDPQLAGHLHSIYGTPNEPERELSAGDTHAALSDITAALRNVCAYLATEVDSAALRALYAQHADVLDRHAQRLQDAPPY